MSGRIRLSPFRPSLPPPPQAQLRGQELEAAKEQLEQDIFNSQQSLHQMNQLHATVITTSTIFLFCSSSSSSSSIVVG